MNKNQYKSLLTERSKHPETIRGIHNWCDSWCERCSKTMYCTVFKTSSHLLSENPEDFFKMLSMIFDATIAMIKDYCEKSGIDFESLKTRFYPFSFVCKNWKKKLNNYSPTRDYLFAPDWMSVKDIIG